MNSITTFFSSIIYFLSSSLLVPTLALLVVCFVWVVLDAGGMTAEAIERARLPKVPPEDMRRHFLREGTAVRLPHQIEIFLERLWRLMKGGAEIENTLDAIGWAEVLARKRSLDHLRLLVRLGPSLGLMGTLIPLGTGLASIGTGDMSRLAADLVIAFTTTVVGLAIGMAASVMLTIKRRWVEKDVHMMESAVITLAEAKCRELK